jgi:DNA-binding transcriptional LysR family regulator
MTHADLRSGRLVTVLDAYEATDFAIHAVWPHHRHLSPKVRAFVDFLAERFGPVPDWDLGLRAVSTVPADGPLP